MIDKLEASVCFKNLRDAASTVGATLVSSPLLFKIIESMPMVLLDYFEFKEAVIGLRPHAIYAAVEKFQAEEKVHDQLVSELDLDEDEQPEDPRCKLSFPAVRSLVKSWQKYDGANCVYTASFVVDGVLHHWTMSEGWYEAFDDRVEELINDLRASEEDERRLIDLDRRTKIKERARVLSGHAKFNAPKATKARRAYLAAQLFPDAEDLDIAAMVEEAESISWYQLPSA